MIIVTIINIAMYIINVIVIDISTLISSPFVITITAYIIIIVS